MKTLTRILPLLLLALALTASRRGEEARLGLELSSHERFTDEAFFVEIPIYADGFVYFYSLDPNGDVSLLYPLTDEDGRGQVSEGDTLQIDPLLAGPVPGIERLVAVHTLEYREIRASRHQFKAPDPDNLEKIHERMTRSRRELGNYAETSLRVLSLEAEAPDILAEDVTASDDTPGVVVHHHVYDYWCSYCDCWHPACTASHCWCGWEVVSHYHSHYHYSHCFLWGHWHGWWRPPMVYVYVRGGSRWDYDTRPWRGRLLWGMHRDESDRWREVQIPLVEPDVWVETHPRAMELTPEPVSISREFRDERTRENRPVVKSAPRTWTTTPRTSAPTVDKPAPAERRWESGSSVTRPAPSSKPEPRVKPAPVRTEPSSSGTGSRPAPKAKVKAKPAPKPKPKPEPEPKDAPKEPAKGK